MASVVDSPAAAGPAPGASAGTPVAAVAPALPAAATERRLAAALWCAGVATFALLYAPQGLLTEVAAGTGVPASRASLLISAATAGLALSVLPWAWLSDRVGRPAAMRAAAVAAAALSVAVPLLPTFDLLVAGRLLQGAALGGIPALAMTLVHESASPLRAGSLAGSYVAATSIGGLSGRLLAAPAGEWLGWRGGLVVVGGALTALMVALVVLLPRGARPDGGSSGAGAAAGRGWGRAPSRGAVRVHLRDPRMLALFAVGGLLVGGMVAIFNYLPFRLEARPYGLAPTAVSLIFLTYLAGTAGSRAAAWLAGRWSHRAVVALGGALLAVGALVTLAGPLVVVVTGVVVLVTGLFVGHAVASSRVGARAATGRAQATALYTVTYYLGSSVLGWLAGLAWDGGGWPLVAGMVAALGAVALVLALYGERPAD
jgi:predicted MFS family arabinose efflux permease